MHACMVASVWHAFFWYSTSNQNCMYGSIPSSYCEQHFTTYTHIQQKWVRDIPISNFSFNLHNQPNCYREESTGALQSQHRNCLAYPNLLSILCCNIIRTVHRSGRRGLANRLHFSSQPTELGDSSLCSYNFVTETRGEPRQLYPWRSNQLLRPALPVSAIPMMSLFWRPIGMACRWMAVGSL